MLDINKGGQITYRDTYPALPNGNNVASLVFNSQSVDFLNATKYYTVSTVNYLAAGSCNFNNGGVTLWPLDQIVADTQYYVRDAVVNYIPGQTQPIAPAIEGRLAFVSAPDLATSRKTVVDADGDGAAEAGEVLTYTITITNNGSYGAGVVLVDALPPGLTYVPNSLSVSYPSGSPLIPNFVAQFYGNTLMGHTDGYLNPPSGGSLYLPTNVIALTFRAQVSNPLPSGTSLSNSIDLQDQIMSYPDIPAAVIRLPYRIFLPIIMK